MLRREARFKLADQLIAARVRQAESELSDLLWSNVATCQVLARLCAGWAIQVALEEALRGLMHLHEGAPELGIRVRVFALRHADAVALSDQLERLKKADALDFHNEL